LRSKQVPQAASSPPKPFPETKKGTEKDASLRNRRILAAIGIVIVAVVLWKVCFSGPNIAVTEKIRRHKEPLSNEQVLLEVTVTTLTTKKPEDLIVVLNGPWGTDWGTRTHTIDNSCFLRDGSWTGRFLLSDSEFKAGQYRTI
jgi:hypothetical protein